MDYLCNAGPPFKMHVYPDEDPSGITYWTLGSRRSNETPDVNKRGGGATATAYGPSKFPVSARFQQEGRHSHGSNETSDHSNLHFKHLVVDDNPKHTGRDLCESPTSLGPDFFSVADGSFCRMADKTLWPVCKGNVADNCFDADVRQLIVGGVAARDSPYENVIDWTSG